MFSDRTAWSHEKNPLTRLLEEKRLRGELIIDLTLSNPTVAGFNGNDKQILLPLSVSSSLVYNPHPYGLDVARNAVSEFYHQQHITVDPANILLTASTSEAYSFLFRLLCDPGDSVLIPTPSYPLFDFLARLDDVSLQRYRLEYDGEWHIDLDSLRCSITSTTRAIVLLHPNNLTGSFVSSTEREAINELATSHNLPLIVDEVFHSYTLEEDPPPSFASRVTTLTFTLNGISKLFGLPQMKLAWVALSGPPHLLEESRSRLDVIADTFLSVNTPVQSFLPSYFEHLAHRTKEIRERVKDNFSRLQSILNESTVSVLRSNGGWSAVLRLPSTQPDDMWAMQLLEQRGVLTHPGSLFAFDQGSHLVVSLLPPGNDFADGIEIIREYVERKGS